MKSSPSIVINGRALKSTGPIVGRILAIDLQRQLCRTSFGNYGTHIVPASLVLSANIDAWSAGLTWAPKYWRSGIGDNLPDWGDIPPERRAREENKNPIDDIPETLSLADFPGTPGPTRTPGKGNE